MLDVDDDDEPALAPAITSAATPMVRTAATVRRRLNCFVDTRYTSLVATATRPRLGTDAGALMAELTMPRLSDTMQEGTLARWVKQPGDQIARGDVVAEIETDKATMEFEAVDDRVVSKILA